MEKELPKNWVNCNLSDIFEIITGNTPSKNHSEYYGNEIPWVKPGDINKSIEIFDTEEHLSKEGFKKSRKIPVGSVMVTCIGNLGNTAIAGVELATNQQINSIVINHDLINKKYVYYYSKILKPWLIENSTSTTIAMVNKSNFEKCPFILPPFTEQNRIVEKLDALFIQHEVMKKALECIPQLLKDFRKQILTHAVTGKLTEEWRKGKYLEEWDIKKIIDNRKTNKAKNSNIKYMKGYFNAPQKWSWFKLYDIMNLVEDSFRYGVVQPGDDIDDEQKLIRVQDIINKSIDISLLRGIKHDIDNQYKSARIKLNTILISIVGTIGRTYLVEDNVVGFNIARAIAKIPIEIGEAKFVKYYLDSSFSQELLNSQAREVARKTLNLEQLKEIEVVFPPLNEQQEIVSRIESIFAKADVIEQRYKTLKEKIDNLPQAILHKAFKGKLSEQLEADGDAKDLLDEIISLKNGMKK